MEPMTTGKRECNERQVQAWYAPGSIKVEEAEIVHRLMSRRRARGGSHGNLEWLLKVARVNQTPKGALVSNQIDI